MKINVPKKILEVKETFAKNNFKIYLVGGCLRDLLLKKTPKDWDLTTNATPKEILKLYPDSFYENSFGTVGIKDRATDTVIEVTTFREESNYKDFRHPEKVKFSNNILTDLKRRDFTINAIAYDLLENKTVDPFLGQTDLAKKIVKSVNNPSDRFKEDALRLLRAVRFANTLNFKIEEKTFKAILENAPLIQKISSERIRDEFKKIMLSQNPADGIELLRKSDLLKYFLPEIHNTIGIAQNFHHKRTVYDHLIHSLRNCKNPKLSVRLACLFHDVAKPQTKKGAGQNSTFYNHEYVGANLVYQALKRLRFSNKICTRVSKLVRNHMFYYEVDTVTPSSVRRLLGKVGPENIDDLMDLRIADRLGSDCKKAKPYKLRHLEYLIEKVSQDPISVKMLKINGDDLFKEASIEKGPKMGAILNILLSKVIENPKLNTKKTLIKEAKKLNQKNLQQLGLDAQKAISQKIETEDKKLKDKFYLK